MRGLLPAGSDFLQLVAAARVSATTRMPVRTIRQPYYGDLPECRWCGTCTGWSRGGIMATTQNQDDNRRSMEGAASSQDRNQSGAMTRTTPTAARLSRPFGPLSPFSPFSPFSMMRRMFADLERMLDPLMPA